MTATISVEETIGKQFDTFYTECEFQNIELSSKLKRLLQNLEGDVITEAGSDYTTEYHSAWEEGYEEGREEGWDAGNDEGRSSGYDEGYEAGAESK